MLEDIVHVEQVARLLPSEDGIEFRTQHFLESIRRYITFASEPAVLDGKWHLGESKFREMLITVDLNFDATGYRIRLRNKSQFQNVVVAFPLCLHVGSKGKHAAQSVENRPHWLGMDEHQVNVFAIPWLWLQIKLIERRAASPGQPLGQIRIRIDCDNCT